MNVNFELYRIFYTVANHGNITKASEKLLISQPAISKAIKNLEDQLGGQLFVRTKRGVFLTEEGKEFYNYIKKAMEYIHRAENKFTDLMNLEKGNIRIGVSTTLVKEFLLPYLEEFHNTYPNITIEIVTDLASVLIPKLRNGLIDIIILNLNGKEDFEDIEFIKCREIHDAFVVGKKYEYLINKKLSLADLNNYPLILQSKTANTRKFLDDVVSKYNVVLNPCIELASYSLVVQFAKIGMGIGYATVEYIQNELDNKKLFKLDICDIPSRFIAIGLCKNMVPNFSTKKLLEIINKKR